jgi:electron transfer flavoprotein beta subunit
MKIVVPVKYVPEPTATWGFSDDLTIDRGGVEGRLSELDEYAVEQAVRLVEGGIDAEVVALTVGPAKAADALRKALAMGADSAVHVVDDAMHGSDAVATSLVLAAAIRQSGFDLVVTGMASPDAEMSVVPSMVAERLGVPQITFAATLAVDTGSGTVAVRRDGDTASEQLESPLPAIVSVTDQTGEARYPAFKAIMASKKKPVTKWSLDDLGIDAAQVGIGAAACVVRSIAPRPPRQAGTVVVDEGDGAVQIADFLAANKFL